MDRYMYMWMMAWIDNTKGTEQLIKHTFGYLHIASFLMNDVIKIIIFCRSPKKSSCFIQSDKNHFPNLWKGSILRCKFFKYSLSILLQQIFRIPTF